MIGGHFGATLESLWSSLGPLYVYECDFRILLQDFEIILIFPIYFNDFIKLLGHLEATLGNFWVTLTLLSVYDGGFGSLLGHFGATLGT